ncbi:glycosyltransferase [Terasakiella sp.]|uniref:glycosyltransferase n=1 Tax=Terasakiella sp. TaxID=2034861 RepID=UPI003AA8CAAC
MRKEGLFIGHFSQVGASKNKAASIAGDLVQLQIVRESERLLGKDFKYISMEPCQCWPKGPLWIKGGQVSGIGLFPPLLNLPVLKGLLFAIFVSFYILKLKPNYIVQYNSYLFENISILLASRVVKAKAAIVVQDVRFGSAFSKIASLYDYISNGFVRYFDLVVPVSEKLANYLKLSPEQYFLFLGGITEPGLKMLEFERHTENYAVFAGALEPHNGIDRLLSVWADASIGIELHIFGRGSLSETVKKFASKNKNIIYHGFLPQQDVASWQAAAKFNICLRYNEGLEEEYFFPSKLFNIACCPGLLVCNEFKNLPDLFSNELGVLRNDLSNLVALQNVNDNDVVESAGIRRMLVTRQYSWKETLKKIYS